MSFKSIARLALASAALIALSSVSAAAAVTADKVEGLRKTPTASQPVAGEVKTARARLRVRVYRRFHRPRVRIRVYTPRVRVYVRSPRRARRCDYWRRRCIDSWGYGKSFRGCMRYHGCSHR